MMCGGMGYAARPGGFLDETCTAPPAPQAVCLSGNIDVQCASLHWHYYHQGAPKERRRGRAEKRLSKRVFLESPFLLCPLEGLL